MRGGSALAPRQGGEGRGGREGGGSSPRGGGAGSESPFPLGDGRPLPTHRRLPAPRPQGRAGGGLRPQAADAGWRGAGAAQRATAHRLPLATPLRPVATPAAAGSLPPIGRRRRCPAPFTCLRGKRGTAEARLRLLAGGAWRWRLAAAARCPSVPPSLPPALVP